MIEKTNRFYTILVIPEKTSQVRRILIPGWLFKGGIVAFLFAAMLAVLMVLDYWYVMSQINENKQLKLENRRLKQQVQIFRNKMNTVDSTLDRIKTFATRLKVITNIEDRGGLLQSLNNGQLPDAATNIGAIQPRTTSSANSSYATTTDLPFDDKNPEEGLIKRDFLELDSRFSDLMVESLLVEQVLQDQYELLADKRAFLAALPTKKPAVGYFTSGFGIRRAPYGGRVKMHEGLDIANFPGTTIRAPADGIVKHADVKSGYGQTLIIDHGYGLETWYAHNKKLLVKKGQKIKRGDTVAQLGNSGRSTGPHLHYEVRINGTPVDPISYILEN